MSSPAQSRFWPRARRCFRWFRICCLLLVLAAVSGVIYLNQVGLPGFIKDRLVDELRARGVDLQFERMRLHWYRGIVAERVSLGRSREPRGPQLSAGEVTVKLNDAALREFRFDVDSLVLRQGRMIWPLVVSNEPPYRIALDDVQTELRFLPHDQWELAEFQGRCLGLKLNISGMITNAQYLRQWRKRQLPAAPGRPAPVWPRQLREVAQTIEKIHFTAAPEMYLNLQLDARNTNQFAAELRLQAAGARTPWGTVENVLLSVPVRPVAGSNGVVRTEVKLRFDQAATRWGNAGQTRLNLRLTQSLTNPLPLLADVDLNLRQVRTPQARARSLALTSHTSPATNAPGALRSEFKLNVQGFKAGAIEAASANLSGTVNHLATRVIPLQADLSLSATTLATPWGKATGAELRARTSHSATNWVPLLGDGTVKLTGADTPWGKADTVNLTTHFTPADGTVRTNASWAWWSKLAPAWLDWSAQFSGLKTPQVELPELSFSGRWHAPELELRDIKAAVFDGTATVAATLNVDTGEARLTAGTDFEPRRIAPWLQPASRRWLDQYSWTKPPLLQASASVILPATLWTNAQAVDWRADVLPRLSAAGSIQMAEGAFRGISFANGRTDLTLTNSLLHLPNLRAERPEGKVALQYSENLLTSDYHFHVDSHIDPQAIRPLIDSEEARKALDLFAFPQMPSIRGDLWGRWHALERTGFQADLLLTNVAFRGVSWSGFTAGVWFTNQMLQATNIHLWEGARELAVEHVLLDVHANRLFATNGVSTIDPLRFTEMIGPKTKEAIEPYRFMIPPRVLVHGSLPLNDESRTDLHFEIDGGPFNYWKFNLPHVTASAHWVTNQLMLTNVVGEFYGGEIRGGALFDFSPRQGSDFQFHAEVTNASLHQFMADMTSPTNKLEGVWDGVLNVTSANSHDWKSWQGFGSARLHDGFLWDIPLVGIFSPVLNAVAPGLGKSRVKEGTATYVITNSIIYTKDLELRAPAMRLQYDGTVDFDGNVKARVEAELLRDTWLVGPIMRLALMPITKMFEFKVTGTLGEPKKTPLYIPKVLLMPFQPFRVLKDLLPSGQSNPKPAEPPPPK